MKNIFIFLFLLFPINVFSQNLKTAQNIVKLNGDYKITYNNMYFDVDTTTITIKLKDINKLNNKFSMVRKNKLGFIDLKKSPTISIEEFVDTIIYSTYGKYNSFTPNDSNINNQWYLSSTKVMDAWNITTGNPSVIVAVLDSGTDWTHSDLGLGSNGYQNMALLN